MTEPITTPRPAHQPLYAGFDLGTTNSAAAAFDGDKLTVIRNSQGGSLTPSIVRIDAQGRVSVGQRALRYLERDPENTRAEFKRLMGSGTDLTFPAADIAKRPEELAAEVLRSLRADMQDQLGVAPVKAVISVPALFELPQSAATSEAARLAGFEQVELLQEPIASALAAGWSEDSDSGAWLVYDLGGGTFDVSVLETRDGLLRVVGHDGDNFLGGRDFDLEVVNWAIGELASRGVAEINRDNPAHAGAVGVLKRAAEEAKIALSRDDETDVFIADLAVGQRSINVDLSLDRDTLESLCAASIDRTLTVCERLLAEHGVSPGSLSRIVLVGGPTVMPAIRRRVGERLGAPVAEGYDPMTLVAQGAALYAATAGLDGRADTHTPASGSWKLWMQYPAVSSDLTPHIVGKVVGDGEGDGPATIALARTDGQWKSPAAPVSEEGGFVTMVDLLPRRPNVFRVIAESAAGAEVAVDPVTITIVQGLTITDPPLSRSVGVALANDRVCTYFERGAPLPARKTFTHHTIESVAAGSDASVLKIPLVQGEFEQAHLCRLVGTLEINGRGLSDSVPTGSPIEVTLELDRGGALSARALIPSLGQTFDSVARLLVPDADPETLEAALEETIHQLAELRAAALRAGADDVVARLEQAATEIDSADRDIVALRGGDHDAGQKARRTLIELDALLADLELEKKWPELEASARDDLGWASLWVSQHGTPAEQRLLDEVAKAVEQTRASRDINELQRQLRLARRLGTAAMYRDPDAWEWMFEGAVAEIDRATDLPRAHVLVEEGRAAIARGDHRTLRRITEKLWRLLPTDAKHRRLSFDSGVR
jgi:molecular chaperone DnaK